MYIRMVLIREDLLSVVDGSYDRPKEPKQPEGSKALLREGQMIPAAPPTAEEVAKYNKDLKYFSSKWVEWQNMNMKAFSTISFLVVPDVLVHISEMNDAKEAMNTLFKICGQAEGASIDTYYARVARSHQQDFASLTDYANHIKINNRKLIDMGKVIPPWALASSFRRGLNPDLLDLTSHILHTAKHTGKEVTMDDMLVDLLEHERRKEDQEKTANTSTAKKAGLKAFGGDNNNKNEGNSKGKVKGSGNQNKPESSRAKSKNRNQNDNEKRECTYNTPCNGCGSFWHRKDECYYLNEDLRPEGWKCHPSKQKLLIENRQKGNKSNKVTTEDNGSKSSEKRVYQVLRTGHFHIPDYPPSNVARKATKDQKDPRFWLDTAADIHISYDINDFDSNTYKEVKDEAVTVADDTPVPILGKGNMCVEVILDGDQKDIAFANAYYVPEMVFKMISLGTLEQKGCSFTGQNGRCTVKDPNNVEVFTSTRVNTGYVLDTPEIISENRRILNDVAVARS